MQFSIFRLRLPMAKAFWHSENVASKQPHGSLSSRKKFASFAESFDNVLGALQVALSRTWAFWHPVARGAPAYDSHQVTRWWRKKSLGYGLTAELRHFSCVKGTFSFFMVIQARRNCRWCCCLFSQSLATGHPSLASSLQTFKKLPKDWTWNMVALVKPAFLFG